MTDKIQMSIPFSDYILSFGNASFRPQCPSDTMTYVAKTPENDSELQFSSRFPYALTKRRNAPECSFHPVSACPLNAGRFMLADASRIF